MSTEIRTKASGPRIRPTPRRAIGLALGLLIASTLTGATPAAAHVNTVYCGHGHYQIDSTDRWIYDGWRNGTGWYHEHKYLHWNGGAGILHWGWTRCPYSH